MTTNTITVDNSISSRIGNYYINLTIAITGMLLATYANLLSANPIAQKWNYFIAAVLMLYSAVCERQKYFIVLQLVVAASTAIALTSTALVFKTAFPITLSIFAIIYFTVTKQMQDRLTVLGCLGLVILAVGYGITNPLIYFLGAIVLMLYAYFSYRRGVTIAIVWVGLNILFSITALIAVYHRYFIH